MYDYCIPSTNDIQDSSFLCIEGTLLSCFDDFKRSQAQKSFELYKQELESTNLQGIFSKYPVAENLLKESRYRIDSLLSIIAYRVSQNRYILQEKNAFNIGSLEINDINVGVGDFHRGMSTAVVQFVDGQKVVFKPTNYKITESYFKFLDWANQYYPLGDYRYQVVSDGDYHWLEFVNHQSCQSEEELKVYYQRAGFLLSILYVFNAVDFHYENVIAKGMTPVMIDHETIIQPKIHVENQKFFKNFIPVDIEDSVLSTMLLPIHHESYRTMPVGTCGYGYHKQTNIQLVKKEAVDRYTDNWRFITKFARENFQKENIPTLNGEPIYPVAYLDEFLSGFEEGYQLFLSKRKFLLEDTLSPIQSFTGNTIRFIWRATNIYAKIHDQMKLPKNLVNYEHYRKKMYDYLAVAFKNVSKDSDLMFILQHEVAQMMRGDIPFFEVSSSSRDLETEFGTIKNFFEYSAVENSERKLNKLSYVDLEVQKSLIKKSLLN